MTKDHLLRNLTAPGTAAGMTLGWFAKRPTRRVIDIGAITAATGKPIRTIAWGIAVLRVLRALPADVTLAPTRGDPCQDLVDSPTSVPPDSRQEKSSAAPSAPINPAMNHKFAQRSPETPRQPSGAAMEAAKAWLLDVLADRPVRARVVRAKGEEAGFSWRTLQRARVEIGANARLRGGDGSVWSAPDHHQGSVTLTFARPSYLARR